MDGGVALDFHQAGHLDRADLADAAQIVAHQVHDHEVLSALLFAGLQVPANAFVVGRGPPARGGALYRPRFDIADAIDFDKALGRRAQDRQPRKTEKGRVWRRVDRAQHVVSGQWIDSRLRKYFVGQADFVGFAAAQLVQASLDQFQVLRRRMLIAQRDREL